MRPWAFKLDRRPSVSHSHITGCPNGLILKRYFRGYPEATPWRVNLPSDAERRVGARTRICESYNTLY